MYACRTLVVLLALSLLLPLAGCRSFGEGRDRDRVSESRRDRKTQATIRRVVCLYDQRPWLNLDARGDRDPEGIRFRAFLDPGTGRGALRDGSFHVEMYEVGGGVEVDKETPKARLVSDWHYDVKDIHTIAHPGILGNGYFLHLRWADKDIAGREVEFITRFEDRQGNVARAATKRFRVPKYSS